MVSLIQNRHGYNDAMVITIKYWWSHRLRYNWVWLKLKSELNNDHLSTMTTKLQTELTMLQIKAISEKNDTILGSPQWSL